MAKKKKATKVRRPLTVLQTPLLMAILLVPVVAFQDAVWVFRSLALHLPLTVESFEQVFHVLTGFRIVAPITLMPFITGALTFIGPLLLLLLFQALNLWLPLRRSLAPLVAFGICCVLSPFAMAGVPPDRVAVILATVLIMSPFFHSTTGVHLWITGTLSVGLSFIFPDLKPLVTWTLFSFVLAQVTNFLFVNRLQPPRKDRQKLLYFGMEWAGTLLFSIWVFVTILKSPLGANTLGPSPYFWLAFVGGGLCAINCLLSPWNTDRWLALATFAQGVLIFKTLDLALYILVIYACFAIVDQIIDRLLDPAFSIPRWMARLATLTTLATFLVIGWLLVTMKPHERKLNPDWIEVVRVLHQEPDKGVLIVGQGMPFVATFYEGRLANYESLLLETDEEEVAAQLRKIGISKIVIEETYLKGKWTEWIEAGQSPKTINRSVLAKLLNYQGKEVNTQTLKLEPLQVFEVLNAKEIPTGFMIATLKN